jgi:hypothetical protein
MVANEPSADPAKVLTLVRYNIMRDSLAIITTSRSGARSILLHLLMRVDASGKGGCGRGTLPDYITLYDMWVFVEAVHGLWGQHR